MSLPKYSKEQIAEAVKKCFSISEVMRHLGYTQYAGGSHFCLSKRIKNLKIDTSHFLGQRVNCGSRRISGRAKKKISSEILLYHKDGKRAKTYQLKRSLVEEGVVKKCFICGIDSWLDKPLTLQIEHKDGDFQNDTKENLIFICPNCHSQTPTYCKKKKTRLRPRRGIGSPTSLRSWRRFGTVGSSPTEATI